MLITYNLEKERRPRSLSFECQFVIGGRDVGYGRGSFSLKQATEVIKGDIGKYRTSLKNLTIFEGLLSSAPCSFVFCAICSRTFTRDIFDGDYLS